MDSQRWTSTSDRYLTPGPGDAWATEAQQSGQRGSQRILDVDTVPGREVVTKALGLPDHTEVVVRRRLILANNKPVEIADSYWPLAIAGNTPLADPAKIPGGAVTLLAKLGFEPATAREEITATRAGDALTAAGRRALNVEPDDPLLILARTIYDADDTPYEYSVMTMRAQGRQLTYIRRGA